MNPTKLIIELTLLIGAGLFIYQDQPIKGLVCVVGLLTVLAIYDAQRRDP